MKKIDLYTLQQGIVKCGNLANKESIEFVYRIGMINEDVVKRLKHFETSRPKNSDEYDQFIEAQTALIEKYSVKDKDGAMVTQGMNVALANPFKYKEELKELKETYKEAIKKHIEDNKTFEQFLEEEASDFIFVPIPKKHLPSEMTVDQIQGIMSIVEK